MLTFDAGTHIYRDDGRIVQSVTSLIRDGGLYGKSSAYYTPGSAERGTRVHQSCLDLDLGRKITLPVNEHGYLNSYKLWRDLARPVWTYMEQPAMSKRLNLAGTADRVGHDHGGIPLVLDFKTGGPQNWHGLQLALYDLIYDDIEPEQRRRVALHLRRDGKMCQSVEYSDRRTYDTAARLLSSRKTDYATDSKK